MGSTMRVNAENCRSPLSALALWRASLAGCIGYDGDFDRGYQIDEQSLAKVQVGKTDKREALSLMGTPSTTSTVGGDAWYYIGQKMHRALAFMPAQTTDQNVLAIYFDKGGKVAAHRQLRHEGRQGVRLRLAAPRRPAVRSRAS